ncbi:J domain-containing protein [Lacibacter luteus]|uniref:J domain-containing protein n=1 Tax=Lacibacter luteus TaxID=2508719 RepID=UPI0021D1B730|nr:J domain-containing protein [Lacibacter luteus]
MLEIEPSASLPEIKQAYRKLVMLYHPDKNNDDPYALARFAEIKEAYEVLTNPQKKELYLQERWLYKASGKKIGEELITAPAILIKCLELNKQVATMDIHRMNYKAVAERMTKLLNDDTISILIDQKETDVHASIIASMLKSIQPFPYTAAKPVANQLFKLAVHLPEWNKHIFQSMQKKQQQEKWRWLNPLLIVLLTIAICFLIWYNAHF